MAQRRHVEALMFENFNFLIFKIYFSPVHYVVWNINVPCLCLTD